MKRVQGEFKRLASRSRTVRPESSISERERFSHTPAHKIPFWALYPFETRWNSNPGQLNGAGPRGIHPWLNSPLRAPRRLEHTREPKREQCLDGFRGNVIARRELG